MSEGRFPTNWIMGLRGLLFIDLRHMRMKQNEMGRRKREKVTFEMRNLDSDSLTWFFFKKKKVCSGRIQCK